MAEPVLSGSEDKLHRQLDLARRTQADGASECVEDLTECGRVEVAIRLVEVWVIEDVEELGTEFQALTFRELRVLQYGKVNLLERGSEHRVARAVAKGSGRRH